MSLISQQDREITIRALEHYAAEVATTEYYGGQPDHPSFQVNALLNWIRLEYNKHNS